MEEIVILIIWIIIWIIIFYSIKNKDFKNLKSLEFDYKELENVKLELNNKLIKYEENINWLNNEIVNKDQDIKTINEKNELLLKNITNLKLEKNSLYEKNNFLNERLENWKKEIEDIKKTFKEEFENISNRLLEESRNKLSKNNEEKLNLLLKPFSNQIEKFEKKIAETHISNVEQHSSLKEQILQINNFSKSLSDEANNLAKAIKWDSKTQWDWGEVMLTRILETSWLEEWENWYTIQKWYENNEWRKLKPDVIINLPWNKHIIIDSKVSLTSYERYFNIWEKSNWLLDLNWHVDSIRKHIKELSEKNYTELYWLDTPEFVFMFIPIEWALSLAVNNKPEILNDAWKKKIIIVSPTTLFSALKTVASIWGQEKITKNALEIAKEWGALYDKFVWFMDDLEKIWKHIDDTQTSYEKAFNKLYKWRWNIIWKVEKLKNLWAKTTKSIDIKFIW